MKIKTSELFCSSPASTAICTTMNHHAMVRRGGGGSTPRAINPRHNNYYNNHYQFDFNDKPKLFKSPSIPCTSQQQHIDPKPYTAYLQKARKSTSAAVPTGKNGGDEGVLVARRKSSAELIDRNNNSTVRETSSSRYLLNDKRILFTDLRDSGGVCNAGALVVSEPAWPVYRDDDDSPALVKSRSSAIRLDAAVEYSGNKCSRSGRSRDQVVELRVSIHCKGCEGKVRKHISRMEGVRSFHIDLESKKVTVVGDVTPLSVLSSISKVKSAQLWPSPRPSASSSSPFIAIGY